MDPEWFFSPDANNYNESPYSLTKEKIIEH